MDNSNLKHEDIIDKEQKADTSEVVSVKDWTIYNIVIGLPLIGFIFLIIKALDRNNDSVGNWAKANLLVKIIGMIFFILIVVFVFAIIANHADSFQNGTNNYFDSI